ncbi:MAG: four helix bundle protein [Bacteroidetes bacterium]|nr:four helix bundle protein [Bacteroidota bacterium]
MNQTRKFDLEDRLVKFAVAVSALAEGLPSTISGKYLSSQLIRSGFSPALNYGEAKSAESINDFIHKMKIALKELRETFIALRIMQHKKYEGMDNLVESCYVECNELISIFVKSIQTAEKNRKLK